MRVNLKIWKGMQLYIFKENGKFVGCIGARIPLTARQLLDNLQLNKNNAPQDAQSLVNGV
jgi:hypothetical protein